MSQSPYSSATQVASSVPFDNSTNGFTSTDVQAAIEESTHFLASGEASFSSNITTTSASDVLMTSMTITPVAGTYLVWFSTWLTQSTGNQTVTFSLYAGGVQTASTIRTTVPFCGALGAVNGGICHSTNGRVTVNGSQAIELRWHTSAGTATAHNGNLDILRVA